MGVGLLGFGLSVGLDFGVFYFWVLDFGVLGFSALDFGFHLALSILFCGFVFLCFSIRVSIFGVLSFGVFDVGVCDVGF